MFNTGSKPATTFTLTSTVAPASNFGFGGSGDKATTTKPSLFSSSTTTPSFSFPISSAAPTSTLSFGGGLSTGTSATAPSFSSLAPPTAASTAPQLFGAAPITTTSLASATSTAPSASSFQLGSTTAASTSLSLGLSTAGASKLSFPQTSTSTLSSLLPTTTTTSTIPTTSTANISYTQLEDQINKWTIDLEEQGKHFINQAKQLNAWDSLLIQNGDTIRVLNDSIERVKQQQQQLDQDLDFVLAQQKELEELIVPLEKELASIPQSTDQERNRIYQLAESMDSQMKQMSEDLKGIIEHLNESNKEEDANDPVTQISRILNAHMNSLQWTDRNTAQISAYLEQISKMQDMNRRNNVDL